METTSNEVAHDHASMLAPMTSYATSLSTILGEEELAETGGFDAKKEGHDEVILHQGILGGEMPQEGSAKPMLLSVDDSSESDSALEDGGFSAVTSTAFLRSSMNDSAYETERSFHQFKAGEYHLPNDQIEQERLDLQHNIWRMSLSGKLHLAPIEIIPGGLHNVIDIATGTGIWAIDFANEFPSTNVFGVDLSSIQPDSVPLNCHFQIGDVEDPWLFPQKFDYIHGRMLATCFRSHETVFEHAFASMNPGGYLEIQDIVLPLECIDDTMEGTDLGRWTEQVIESGTRLGKDFTRVEKYKSIFEIVGFVDVVVKHYQWPIGTWAKGTSMKQLGAWVKEDVLTALDAIGMGMLAKGLGMPVDEVNSFMANVKKDVKSNKIHAYFSTHVVYGRKP